MFDLKLKGNLQKISNFTSKKTKKCAFFSFFFFYLKFFQCHRFKCSITNIILNNLNFSLQKFIKKLSLKFQKLLNLSFQMNLS